MSKYEAYRANHPELIAKGRGIVGQEKESRQETSPREFTRKAVREGIDLLNHIFEAQKLRRVLLTIYNHWFESRIGQKEALLQRNAKITDVVIDLYIEYNDYMQKNPRLEIVPAMEQMWIVHHLLFQLFGIPFEEQLQLTSQTADAIIEYMGTTDSVTPESLEEERDMLAQLNRVYTTFSKEYSNLRYFIAHARLSSTPESSMREIFHDFLNRAYGFDLQEMELAQQRNEGMDALTLVIATKSGVIQLPFLDFFGEKLTIDEQQILEQVIDEYIQSRRPDLSPEKTPKAEDILKMGSLEIMNLHL
ncbi:MAG: hypothetical protein UX04_C0003G0060 [Microgenomates group bacterium GW2011_GWF2_45_18]|nr:MAG: hypothetical protein UW18_C0002G0060 [Microgenomates group bacterium GW2011_GWF1_44_10]KKU01788.1 MAG: hypothetical protein UX04_C0003G0060 [Microgenomates group bacterium GW2011_GWF2_45_18]OGJ41266.1 MAG: hypothetical protein A2378_04200 [Candidatus Pacebacteria bacterium RIFOXYB1_FULL_44_10]HAU98908.1 hypothetical protein [Candidatus Paceibacterota bacterium]HAX01135.1 hypothetical protein [Candidatus Paceibacterota bacterium]